MATVCAVVVTHDRREMLRECLGALARQTRAPDAVLVVDNASTDGTAAMLAEEFPEVTVRRLVTNEGGAGGFHAGMLDAYQRGFDWLWLMDDDTIPSPTALERLLAGGERADELGEPAWVLASKVIWSDGRLHPMNTALPAMHRLDELVDATSHGLLAIRCASAVSLLVSERAIERFGLPVKRYFIWSDDVEFTARILRSKPGYLVPDSVVHHKTTTAYTTAQGSPERFYYQVRNSIYMTRSSAWARQEKLRILWTLLLHVREFLILNRFRPAAIAAVARGLAHGLVTPNEDALTDTPAPRREAPASLPPA
jgi:GT2 family glycosyltransferase